MIKLKYKPNSIFQPRRKPVSMHEAYASYYGNKNYDEYKMISALASVYTKVLTRKKRVFKEVEKISESYITDLIVSQISEDALSPDKNTGRVLNIAYLKDNKQVQEELAYLERTIDFNQLVKDIAPDIILYGEYVLKVDMWKDNAETKDNKEERRKRIKGVQELLDIVEQGTVVPVTKGSKVAYYLASDVHGNLKKKHKASYVSFYLDGCRIRMDLKGAFGMDIMDEDDPVYKEIPRYIRVGKSKIAPLIGKIKELELLEKLVPATKISKLSEGAIIGVRVSEKAPLVDALNTAQQFESLINKRLAVDGELGDLAVEDIINAAGRTKVIPLYGDKNTLEKMDYKQDEPDELTSTAEDIRKLILDTVGVPYELIYKSDSERKGETLRRYARYLRLLRSLQRCISTGIKQVVYIHLANMGIKYDRNSVSVDFLNKLVDVDNIDRLEHTDMTLTSLNTMRDFVDSVTQPENPLAKYVNLKVYAEYMNFNLSSVGLNGLIDMDKLNADIEKGKLSPISVTDQEIEDEQDIGDSEQI